MVRFFRKIGAKKEYLILLVVVALFLFISSLSLTSINQLRGNARVVNYVGIVRGATQKLVKKELQGYQDDALIARLDSIVNELISGQGPNELIVLPDALYLSNMRLVQNSWAEIKNEIQAVRAGKDGQYLFDLSESYFILVDRTVSSAERFSEEQVGKSTKIIIGINAVFVVFIFIGVGLLIRSAAFKKRAETLGKIAYIDLLTQMPNRASCEREVDKYLKNTQGGDVAVFMFDMNNLKLVNDHMGHTGGDRIIAEFARIIKTEAADFGFIGRYGGDEFLGLFPSADVLTAETFLTRVNEKIISYNLLHVNELEKISFAVGYVIYDVAEKSIHDMINEADAKMYARKRQMKENAEV